MWTHFLNLVVQNGIQQEKPLLCEQLKGEQGFCKKKFATGIILGRKQTIKGMEAWEHARVAKCELITAVSFYAPSSGNTVDIKRKELPTRQKCGIL